MTDPIHHNLDVTFLARELTDDECRTITKAVVATLNEFDAVDFVDSITVGELS